MNRLGTYRLLIIAALFSSLLTSVHAGTIDKNIETEFDHLFSKATRENAIEPNMIGTSHQLKSVWTEALAALVVERIKQLPLDDINDSDLLALLQTNFINSATHTLFIKIYNLFKRLELTNISFFITQNKIFNYINDATKAPLFTIEKVSLEAIFLLLGYSFAAMPELQQQQIPNTTSTMSIGMFMKTSFKTILSDIAYNDGLLQHKKGIDFLQKRSADFMRLFKITIEEYNLLIGYHEEERGKEENNDEDLYLTSDDDKPSTFDRFLLPTAKTTGSIFILSLAASQVDTIPCTNKKIKISPFIKNHGKKIALAAGAVSTIAFATWYLK